jgi:hypothetical protein
MHARRGNVAVSGVSNARLKARRTAESAKKEVVRVDRATQIQPGTHVRAPSIVGDETYVVREIDDEYLIVERASDGTVMPPLRREDVSIVNEG